MLSFFKKYTKYIVLVALVCIPIFIHLDTLSVRQYDEARNAINAYEMYKNGNYIVTHFEGKPDMWNTKPPLLTWCQVAFMKVIGVNEFAVRLPSAIAAFLTCLVLLIFATRYLKLPWLGIIAVFILITSQGYVSIHSTRTGDFDALMTLFTTLSGLLFYWYCEKQNVKHLYLFFICTALAVLTKSINGLLFLPAIFIYSIVRKQFIPLLKSKHFYLGLGSFLLLVSGFYLLREAYNPGFIAAVRENELGGRFLEVLDNHKHPFSYYFKNLVNNRFKIWYLFVPCGLLVGLFIKHKMINRLTLFSSLMILTLFLVISNSQTKLEWYDVPLYPFLAILVATAIYYLFNFLKNLDWIKKHTAASLLPFIFLILIGFKPYKKILHKTVKPQEEAWIKDFYQISYFLKDGLNGKHNLNNQFISYNEYSPHILFYIIMLNEKGIRFANKNQAEFNVNEEVVVHQKNIQQFIEETYNYEITYKENQLVRYKILGRK